MDDNETMRCEEAIGVLGAPEEFSFSSLPQLGAASFSRSLQLDLQNVSFNEAN